MSEYDMKLMEILRFPEWIIDGNYQRTIDIRMKKADTIILFDLPTELCLEGAIARIGTKRENLPSQARLLLEQFTQAGFCKIVSLLKRIICLRYVT